MATIVNTPPASNSGDNSNSAVQLVLGALLLIILAVFLFNYLPPLLSNMRGPETNITVPVPDQVDVNINPQQPE